MPPTELAELKKQL
jgi:hypothetical protein